VVRLKRPDGWTGFKPGGRPDVAPQERFARGFEQYLREGHAPSRALDGVFAQFRDWLHTIYQTLRGLGAPISEDIRQVYDRMLAIDPERRTTVGDVPDRQPNLADIHRADADETHPRDAGIAADRVAAERAQNAREVAPDVANELRPGIADPAGEAGGGAARGGALVSML